MGTVLIAVALAVALPAFAQNTCDSGKLKCMRIKAGCLLKVHEKAIKTGLAPDGVRIGSCQSKFDDPVKGCVAKREAKQNPANPSTVCSIVGNAALLEATVDGCVAAALAGVGSAGGPGTCDSGKLKCMRKKAACLLKLDEKAIKTGNAPDAAKIARCRLKFDDPAKGCIAKLEAKQDAAKPPTLCTATGDTVALEAVVDACVGDAVGDVTTCQADVENPEGLTATGAQLLHQDSTGVDDVAETDDRFGSTLLTGDFDGDGFDDLVVGIPGENAGAGALAVLYGAATGLYGTSRDDYFTPADVNCDDELMLRMSQDLAVGDFNGDGRDDLVSRCTDGNGTVQVVYGSPTGLSAGTYQLLGGYLPGSVGPMIAGAFDADGYDDLVELGIGIDINTLEVTAARLITRGTASGLQTPEATELPELEVPSTLATGDFDSDPTDDLVEGYPTNGPAEGGEIVVVLNPFTPGETSTEWNQDSPGMIGGSEAGDAFGAALAVADFNGDGVDDVTVGVPGEDSAQTGQGAFHRLFGDGTGLTATGNQLFGAITVQIDAGYGGALAAGRFDNADAAHELAVGAPLHDVASFTDTGYVDVRFGSATTNRWWQGADTGIPGNLESNDQFGEALAVGDFNGDGADDLAVGVPRENVNSATDGGVVNVLYGTPSQCQP